MIRPLCVCVGLIVSMNLGAQDAEKGNKGDAHLIWANPLGGGTIQYACYCDEQWTKPTTISAKTGLALAPSIVKTNDGIVVFWVELFSSGDKKPFFAELSANGDWSKATSISTQAKSTSAITGAIDGDGRFWLTWSGNNWDLTGVAQTSDIYAGEFKDGVITDVEKVHKDNEESDLMPTIAMDKISGNPVISWIALTPNQPETRIAIRSGNSWSRKSISQIDADFNRPEFSSNIATGIVPLDTLDLPVPSFINPEQDQISVVFANFSD